MRDSGPWPPAPGPSIMDQMGTCGDFDILVIGGGHAGTEAALAAARMGARTALLTSNLDTIAQMSCNPAIGGVAKGQIVREIDALGGVMGRAIDATAIQFRMLNRRKGPAMHGPRAQADTTRLPAGSQTALEEQPGLTLRQETVEDLLVEGPPGGSAIAGVARPRRRRLSRRGGRPLRRHLHAGPAARRRDDSPGGRMGEATTAGHQPRAGAVGPSAGPLQDRHAAPAQRPHHRLSPRPKFNPATTSPSRSRSSPIGSIAGNCPAGSPTPRRRSTS